MAELPGPFPRQLLRAFGPGGEGPPEPCVVAGSGGGTILLRMLRDGSTERLAVGDGPRLAAVLGRPDLCLRDGLPLALVGARRGALLIATGPRTPPGRLAILASVARLEGGRAVELPADGPGQPAWQAFALRPLGEGPGPGPGAPPSRPGA